MCRGLRWWRMGSGRGPVDHRQGSAFPWGLMGRQQVAEHRRGQRVDGSCQTSRLADGGGWGGPRRPEPDGGDAEGGDAVISGLGFGGESAGLAWGVGVGREKQRHQGPPELGQAAGQWVTQVPLPLPASMPPRSDALWASHTSAFLHGASLSPPRGCSARAPALVGKSDGKRERCPSGAAGR